MNKLLGVEQFQEYSEVDLFNKIGFMASTLGYVPVYFKEDGMKISIYYDKYNLGAMFPEQPYYELYDRCDTERFLDTDEEAMNLFNRVKELIG